MHVQKIMFEDFFNKTIFLLYFIATKIDYIKILNIYCQTDRHAIMFFKII